MLMAGLIVPGMIWLFVGSFSLMAWTYRKPWRLGVISCFLPPLAAAVCYLIQFGLFGSNAPPIPLLLPVLVVGVGFGYWRARTHEVTEDKNGGIVAQRTIGYLVVWAAAYGVTQILGFMSADTFAIRAGLVTGAFSTVMLGMVSLIIWRQYKALKMISLAMAVSVLFSIAPQEAYAQNNTSLCDLIQSSAGREIQRTLQRHILANLRTTIDDIDFLGSQSNFCYIRYGFGGDNGGGHIKLDIDQSSGRKKRYDLEVDAQTDGSSSTVRGMIQTSFQYSWGGAEGTYVGDGRLAARNDRTTINSRADIEVYSLDEFDVTTSHDAQALLVEITEQVVAGLRGVSSRVNDNPLPDPGGNASSGYFGGSGEPSPPEPPALDEETAISVATLISIILIASGVAVNVAQAIAAAVANAVQAGVQLTAEDIQDAVSDAIGGEDGANQLDNHKGLFKDEEPVPDKKSKKKRGPTLYDREGKAFERDDQGRYWAPDKTGEWRWIGEKAARRASKALRGELAQREKEVARHDRETRENLDRSRRKIRERHARERAGEARKKADREAASAKLERVERAANKLGDIDILTRTGEDRVFKDDGSIDTEYLGKVKKTLRGRIGRDVVMPDSELEDNGWGRVLGETLEQTVDDSTNSLPMRILTGVATGGTSEVGFQGRQIWQTVKKATEDAEDQGKELSATDAMKIVGEKIVKDNLPVNTLDALNRWRKGEPVSLTELATTMLADGFSALEVAQVLKVKPGEVLESVGRRVISEGAMDTAKKTAGGMSGLVDSATRKVQTIHGKANDLFEDALERVGVRNTQSRLGVDHAAERFKNGRLRPETEELIARMKAEPPPKVASADSSFEAGRARGQQRVEGLANSLDELGKARKSGKATPSELARLEQNVRDDVIRVQADKHAMNEMNKLPKDGAGNNKTIQDFNKEMNQIYDQADRKMIERLAEEYGVRPEDIQPVTITNKPGEAGVAVEPGAPARDHSGHASPWKGDGSIPSNRAARSTPGTVDGPATGRLPDTLASPAKGDKVSFDRDLTMRVRTVVDGKVVYRDIPSTTTGRIYNEEFYKAATGRRLTTQRGPGFSNPNARELGGSVDFKDTHLSSADHLTDVTKITDPDVFARRTDQATTDRLHPEAYGTGQADLIPQRRTFSRAGLTDPTGTAKTVEFNDHWANEADSLREMAAKSRNPVDKHRLLEQAEAHMEEGQRQIVKQYGNMAIKRTQAMQALGNAAGAKIPLSLSERIGVLKRTQMPLSQGGLTPAQAEAVLGRMGTSTRQVSRQLSAYVEGLQILRSSVPKPGPSVVFQGWQDDFKHDQGRT